jgi:hypothetical protein
MSKPRMTLRHLIESLPDVASGRLPGLPGSPGADDGCYPDPPGRGSRACYPEPPGRDARGCVPDPPAAMPEAASPTPASPRRRRK